MRTLVSIAACAAIAGARFAAAHHSVVLFDMTTTVTIHGTVQKLVWSNPHVWLWVEVEDEKGGSELWSIEGAAVDSMKRRGWNKRSLRPGDKVTVELHPVRDGRPSGDLGRVILANGQVLGP